MTNHITGGGINEDEEIPSPNQKINYTQELMKIVEEGCLDIIRYFDGTPQAAIASSVMNRTKKLRQLMESEYNLKSLED